MIQSSWHTSSIPPVVGHGCPTSVPAGLAAATIPDLLRCRKPFNPIIDRFRSPQIEDLSADQVITRYDKPQAVHLVDLSLAKAEANPAILAAVANIAGKAVVRGSTAAEREFLATAKQSSSRLARRPKRRW